MDNTVYELFSKNRIFPIFRGVKKENVVEYVALLLDSGINTVEIALSTSDGLGILEQIASKYPDVIVGAGTVLSVEDAVRAIDSGAKYLVSPGYIPYVVGFAKSKNIFMIPGAATATEITELVLQGISFIKIFPAVQLTPSFFKEIKGPFPNIKMIASGGITINNAKEYVQAGAYAISMGTGLFKDEYGANISENQFKERIEHLKRIFDGQ
jgi:2-dehydro-3-deoxyphosphogluconate aldolase/(4S)-4-hydroxy-2-oxoglutarate aldolase